MLRKILRPHAALAIGILAAAAFAPPAKADDIGCVKTGFQLIGPDNQICVQGFDDPKVSGVACHLSFAKAGGIGGALGIATDPSKFSLACRQIGPITINGDLKPNDLVFSESASLFFKETKVVRMFDKARNTLVYLVYSTRLINGSPFNSISTVPIMPWKP